MNEKIYKERQGVKERNVLYKEAALRLYPGASIVHGTVTETLDKDGAHVEVVVWVPASELSK